MSTFVTRDVALLLAPFLGAALQEILHWYNLRMKLRQQKYIRLLRSPYYWSVVLCFVVATGGICQLWFWDVTSDPKTLFLFGASVPALMKQAGSGALAKAHLGAGEVVNDYFLAR